jgi:AAA ATPase domain
LAQNIFIDGIGISSYKSFGTEIQRIGPFEKINLFIGQNNSGKSNILSFLHEHYKNAVEATRGNQGSPLKFEELDKHKGQIVSQGCIAFGLKIEGEKYKALLNICKEKIPFMHANTPEPISSIESILKSKILAPEGKIAWFDYLFQDYDYILWFDQKPSSLLRDKKVLEEDIWSHIWGSLRINKMSNFHSGIATIIPETILSLIELADFSSPQIDLIPAIRQIKEESVVENDHSGAGLIEDLAKLQDPDHNQQDLKGQFEKINEFLKEVIGNRTARLNIPYKRDTILVYMDGRVLPLSSLGTGIHEVIILAAKATVLREQVLCIEELEMHLHPLLQKKLIRYLAENTDNQYFITTHSAHLLDTPGAAIFHVRHSEGVSKVESVYTSFEKSHICADLGYRASDLLQANYIVWVEGPSDRIYINHWINAVAPELIEGLHYSIMFYGGRLLSHLSGEERDVEEREVNKFIDLRSLNRNISIVIDSDRQQEDSSINETKQRIVEEFDTDTGFSWVTKGREIENYIEPDLLEEAVKKVHKNAIRLNQTEQFDHCLPYVTEKGDIKTDIDKVKVAHKVTEQPVNLEVLDLEAMVQKLVDFIRKSNDFNETCNPEA